MTSAQQSNHASPGSAGTAPLSATQHLCPGVADPEHSPAARGEIRNLARQFVRVTGWLCLGFAAASGLGLFLLFPGTTYRHNGPKSAYELGILITVPLLIALSVPLMFLARGSKPARIDRAYWSVLIMALVSWSIAFADFVDRAGEDGFQNALRAWGF